MLISADLGLAEENFRQGRYVETLDILNRLPALSSDPRAVNLLGDTLARLGMPKDAAEIFETSAERADFWRLVFLKKAARFFLLAGERKQAESNALRITGMVASDPDAAYVLLNVLDRNRNRQLLDNLRYNLIDSDDPAHLELAHKLFGEDRSNERLLPLFRNLARLKPDDQHLRLTAIAFAREYADFDLLEELKAEGGGDPLEDPGLRGETPLDNLFWCGDEALNRAIVTPKPGIPFDPATRHRRRTEPHSWGKKLRIGYLSADFKPSHVVMRQLADVLRKHDKSRFEITLFCNTPPADFDRRRFFADMGERVQISDMRDQKAAKEIRRRNIDIVVELGGHTAHSRASLLNLGLAPIQVNWLGYPATATGLDCDYIIGDRVVTPDTSAEFFGEKFCRLPDSYMPNDPTVRPLPEERSRTALGLPEDGFVFASFNAPKKITPRVIAVWARILTASPQSVLWINARMRSAEDNLRQRLVKLGVDPQRIIFAEAIRDHMEHIHRLRAADLALDPFPYTGHATTADCLWAGLPIVALRGGNFASRVSESQLRAIGLGEMVAGSEEEYVALATAIAADPARAKALRARLDEGRFTAPLYDSERFCRHLEAAYELMAARAREGLEPAAIDVPRLP